MARPDPLLDAPGDNLGARGASSAALMGTVQAVRLVVQLASVVLLARLLVPEDFGLIAMVAPIVSLAMLIGDLGINQALITAKTIRQSEASTLFWCNLAIAATLTALLILLSPLIAAFFGEPAVAPIAMALSASVLLSGLATQHMAILARGLRFGAIALVEISAATLGFAAALAIALVHPGPLALVAAQIVSALVILLGAWLATGWIPSRPGTLSSIAGLLRFGAGVTGFNLANFVARNADNIIIGRLAGAGPLGAYDRAYKLLLLPLDQVTRPLGRVMLPILSRLAADPARYRAAYLRTARQILLVSLPGVVFLLMEADRVIPLLLGPGWSEAIPIFTWLAVAGLHQPLTATGGWLFMSQGRSGEYATWGFVNGGVLLCAFLFGVTVIGGAVGVAQAYALTDTLLLAPLVYWVIGRKGPVGVGDFFTLAGQHALAGAAAAFALHLWRGIAIPEGGLAEILHLIGSACLSYLVACLAVALFADGRRALADSLSLVGGLLTRFRERTA